MYTCDRCHACSTELDAVTSAFDDALEVVRRAAVGNAPFRCADIEGTVAERDVGRDRMEREAAALARGDAAFDALSEEWDGLEVEEPHRLEARLAGGVRAARDQLHHFVAATTRPDLEHVMVTVLETFDARTAERSHSLAFKNRNAAASANRSLRMRLMRDYKETIQALVGGARDDDGATAAPPRERFERIQARLDALLLEFLSECKGGSLAWQPLIVLQDHLRMEQIDARERILRDELKAGRPLPPISEARKDAAAVAELLRREARAVPEWLQVLGSQSPPRSSGAAVG